jgi:muramoyltetrapeptide carboxypeptidase
LVAPASPCDRAEFDAGLQELRALGFTPVYDDSVFERSGFVAGAAGVRAAALQEALTRDDIRAVVAVRGGYGSVEVLTALDAEAVREARVAFVGYSDLTSVHGWLGGQAGVTSLHGPMIEGRLAQGESAYDRASFMRALTAEPLGELAPEGVTVIRPGDARGPLFGGTMSQLAASLGTPFAFRPPAGSVLFLEDVAERPYRVRRMLVQLRLSGILASAAALVFGQMPRCNEPGGEPSARDVIAAELEGFPGPVLFGFPSGHTTAPLVTLPFGVEARVQAGPRPSLVFDEAAAGE